MHEIVDRNKKIEHIIVDQQKLHCNSLVRKNSTLNEQYLLLNKFHYGKVRFGSFADCFHWSWLAL